MPVYPVSSVAAKLIKEMRGSDETCSPAPVKPSSLAAEISQLEVQLQPELHDARVPGRGELTEVAGSEVVADVVELCVVEGVKGFHPEFQAAAAFFAEDKVLEERQVPVVSTLCSQRVVA